MRKFESEYRIRETDDVLLKEDAIHRDLDLRVDAVEQIAKEFREGNRLDVDALVKGIEKTFSKLAAEMRLLLDSTAGGISADVVQETAERFFLTAARKAAILEELRGGVDGKGDTLAKLLALIDAIDVSGPVGQAVTDLIGTAPAGRRTLGAVNSAVVDAKAQADAARSAATDASSAANAAQSTADSALPKAGGRITGSLTVDGRGTFGSARFGDFGPSNSEAVLYSDPDTNNLNIRTGTQGAYKYFQILSSGALIAAGGGSFNGELSTTGSVVVGSGQVSSSILMFDIDDGIRTVHNNSGNIGFLGPDNAWKLRVRDDGSVWTAQFGDLSARIDARVNNKSARLAFLVDKSVTTTSGTFEDYLGGIITGFASLRNDNNISSVRFRQLQMSDSAGNWYACGYS